MISRKGEWGKGFSVNSEIRLILEEKFENSAITTAYASTLLVYVRWYFAI